MLENFAITRPAVGSLTLKPFHKRDREKIHARIAAFLENIDAEAMQLSRLCDGIRRFAVFCRHVEPDFPYRLTNCAPPWEHSQGREPSTTIRVPTWDAVAIALTLCDPAPHLSPDQLRTYCETNTHYRALSRLISTARTAETARESTEVMFRVLASIAESKTAKPGDRISAAKALLDNITGNEPAQKAAKATQPAEEQAPPKSFGDIFGGHQNRQPEEIER